MPQLNTDNGKSTSKQVRTRRTTPADQEIGRRVRAQRLEMGMSQTELADMIGVTFQQVQKYEKGVNRIGAGRLHRIADAMKVSITFFYGDIATNGAVKNAGTDGFFAMAQSKVAIRVLRSLGKIKSNKARLVLCDLAELLEGKV
jgi:transcriptional regulator with XRE-family HTH domain